MAKKLKPRPLKVSNWQEQEVQVRKQFDVELAELHPTYVELDGKLRALGIEVDLRNGYQLIDSSYKRNGMTIVEKEVTSAGWTLRGDARAFYPTLAGAIQHLQTLLEKQTAAHAQ